MTQQRTRRLAQRRGTVPRAADPGTAVAPADWRRPPRAAGAARARPSELGLIRTVAAVRNAASSPAMTVATNRTGRQCRVTARNTTHVVSATIRIDWVAQRVL